jgi:AmiR/NasT family two-component response regulator
MQWSSHPHAGFSTAPERARLCRRLAAYQSPNVAEQLQKAPDHRLLIEQAKGVLTANDHTDAATAFERLRTTARSSRRLVVDVAREVLDTKHLPHHQP